MEKKNYLFTSESVSCGHPDKIADQISDAVLDEFLKQDKESKVACETFVTDGLVIVGGEAHSEAYVDIKTIAKKVLDSIGYTSDSSFDPKNFGLITMLHEQSGDIRQGVDKENKKEQGAGDQGIMFGYATNETSQFLPATLVISKILLRKLTELRLTKYPNKIYPDSKSQVTIEYNGKTNKPCRIKTILISTQHSENTTITELRNIIEEEVIPLTRKVLPELDYLFDSDYELLVNPTGRFVIGGPKGDTGLTGRKIVVDTYGGRCPHGGGAFSGKDASKVDRSAAYAARWLAKNIVAMKWADECTVQLSYAIGMAKPLSLYINTNGTGIYDDATLADSILNSDLFDFTPAGIINKFGLKNPIYYMTAYQGHFGERFFEDMSGVKHYAWEAVETDLFKEFRRKCLE